MNPKQLFLTLTCGLLALAATAAPTDALETAGKENEHPVFVVK